MRNGIYADLRDSKVATEKNKMNTTGQTIDVGQSIDFSSFHNMLICSHDDIDSYETLNILNYFGFPLNMVEEEDFWGNSRKI